MSMLMGLTQPAMRERPCLALLSSSWYEKDGGGSYMRRAPSGDAWCAAGTPEAEAQSWEDLHRQESEQSSSPDMQTGMEASNRLPDSQSCPAARHGI